jgi:lysophospholipase L1-like esterase
VTATGKHAASDHGRSRTVRIVVAAVAVSLAVVGVLMVLRQTAPSTPPAGETAVTVASGRSLPVQRSVPGIENLVVYGHSMPKGGGASEPSQGYPVLAAEALGLTLINRAEGGSGAANATLTMEGERPAGSDDAVVLHTGMNDIFRRGAAAVGRGRQAISSFLEGTAEAGRRVIVLECQPGSWADTPPGHDLQAAYEAWNAMLREEVAESPDVEVMDICEIWNPRRFTNVERYHPNDDGHARMAVELTALLTRS